MPQPPGLVWWHWKRLFLCNSLGPESSRIRLLLWHCMQTHTQTKSSAHFTKYTNKNVFYIIINFKASSNTVIKSPLLLFLLVFVFLSISKAICFFGPKATAVQLKIRVLVITLKDLVNFVTPSAGRLLLGQKRRTHKQTGTHRRMTAITLCAVSLSVVQYQKGNTLSTQLRSMLLLSNKVENVEIALVTNVAELACSGLLIRNSQ